MPDQHHLDDYADRAGEQGRGEGSPPAEFLAECISEVGADGEEGAMGEIDDAEHPEDDRQTDRDQHVEKAQHQAVDGLRQNHIEHGIIRYWSRLRDVQALPATSCAAGQRSQSASILQALSAFVPKALATSSGVFGNSALTSK